MVNWPLVVHKTMGYLSLLRLAKIVMSGIGLLMIAAMGGIVWEIYSWFI